MAASRGTNGEATILSCTKEAKKKVSRQDMLQETKRGAGILCRCGKPARITARGQTLCYKCFDAQEMLLERLDTYPGLRERVRYRIHGLDHVANTVEFKDCV